MNFVRNAALQLLTSVIGIPLGILSGVILARYLSVADRGTLALMMSFAVIVVMLAQLGWPSASIYRLRRARIDPAIVAGTGLYAGTLISLLVIALCMILRKPISLHLLSEIPPSLYVIAMMMIPFQLFARIFTGIARGIDRFPLQNLFRIGLSVGNLAAGIFVLILWGKGLHEIAVGLLILEIVATVLLVASTLRHTGVAWRVDLVEAMENLRFGLKSYAHVLTVQIHERIDLFMLAFFLADPKEVAYYAIACSVTERVLLVPEAIGTAMFPKLAGLEKAESGAFASNVSRHSVAWVALTVVVLAIAGPILIPLLYGSYYKPSVAPFLILLPAVGAITVSRVLGRYFVALGRQEVPIGVQTASIVANLLLNIWWIPEFGVIGAAAASLVSYTLAAALIATVYLRSSGRTVLETFLFRRDDLRPYRERLARLRERLREGRT